MFFFSPDLLQAVLSISLCWKTKLKAGEFISVELEFACPFLSTPPPPPHTHTLLSCYLWNVFAFPRADVCSSDDFTLPKLTLLFFFKFLCKSVFSSPLTLYQKIVYIKVCGFREKLVQCDGLGKLLGEANDQITFPVL